MTHDDHRHGLEFDLEALARQRLGRRSLLGLIGGTGLVALAPGLVQAAEACLVDAQTTNGPYPADGSNTAPGGRRRCSKPSTPAPMLNRAWMPCCSSRNCWGGAQTTA